MSDSPAQVMSITERSLGRNSSRNWEADPLALYHQGSHSDKEVHGNPWRNTLAGLHDDFLIQPINTSLGNGTAHSGLGTPTSINKSR